MTGGFTSKTCSFVEAARSCCLFFSKNLDLTPKFYKKLAFINLPQDPNKLLSVIKDQDDQLTTEAKCFFTKEKSGYGRIDVL